MASWFGPGFDAAPVRRVEPDLSNDRSATRFGLGAAARRTLERIFGRDIVFVEFGKELYFNGLTLEDYPDQIFLNVRGERPFLALTGHELLHHLKLQMPDTYTRLLTALEGA